MQSMAVISVAKINSTRPGLWGGRIANDLCRRLFGGGLRRVLRGRLFGFRVGGRRCCLLFGLGKCSWLGNGLLVAFNFSHRFLFYWRRGIRRFIFSRVCCENLER